MVALVTVLLVVAVGLAAGFASGLLGIGGGVLMVPAVLFLVPGADFFEAKAASLLVITVATIPGLLRHNRHGNVDWRLGAFLALGLVGAAVATRAAELVAATLLQRAFGVLLVLAGARMLYPAAPKPRLAEGRARDAFTLGLGLVGGVLSGFFGVGGGIVMVPGLALAGEAMHVAVATSLVGVFLNALSGTASNIVLGYLPPVVGIGIPMAAGSLLGIRFGADTANRLPADRLRRVFGGFLVLVGLGMATGLLR